VKDIIQRVGVTTVIVTHDQEEAFDIADRVVIFNRRGPQSSCKSRWGACDGHMDAPSLEILSVCFWGRALLCICSKSDVGHA